MPTKKTSTTADDPLIELRELASALNLTALRDQLPELLARAQTMTTLSAPKPASSCARRRRDPAVL